MFLTMVIVPAVAALVGAIVGSIYGWQSLPCAKRVTGAWDRLITVGLPAEVRQERIERMAEFREGYIAEQRAQHVAPRDIAPQVLWSCARALLDDIRWRRDAGPLPLSSYATPVRIYKGTYFASAGIILLTPTTWLFRPSGIALIGLGLLLASVPLRMVGLKGWPLMLFFVAILLQRGGDVMGWPRWSMLVSSLLMATGIVATMIPMLRRIANRLTAGLDSQEESPPTEARRD